MRNSNKKVSAVGRKGSGHGAGNPSATMMHGGNGVADVAVLADEEVSAPSSVPRKFTIEEIMSGSKQVHKSGRIHVPLKSNNTHRAVMLFNDKIGLEYEFAREEFNAYDDKKLYDKFTDEHTKEYKRNQRANSLHIRAADERLRNEIMEARNVDAELREDGLSVIVLLSAKNGDGRFVVCQPRGTTDRGTSYSASPFISAASLTREAGLARTSTGLAEVRGYEVYKEADGVFFLVLRSKTPHTPKSKKESEVKIEKEISLNE